ncbi:hypothetical protein ALT721_2410016 [Alteromonas alvinellae]
MSKRWAKCWLNVDFPVPETPETKNTWQWVISLSLTLKFRSTSRASYLVSILLINISLETGCVQGVIIIVLPDSYLVLINI